MKKYRGEGCLNSNPSNYALVSRKNTEFSINRVAETKMS